MISISTREDLSQWLRANEHFPDVHVVRMDPPPRASGVPLMKDVTIELALQVDGGFEAGQTRTMRHIELRAGDVEVFWIEHQEGWDSEYASEAGIAQLDHERPGLQFTVPARVQLVCGRMDVEERATRREVIQPWINDSEFAMLARGATLPTPGEWIEALEAAGQSAVWHPHGGEPVPAENVPEHYGGWFLQNPARIASGLPGVFIFNAEQRSSGFLLRAQDHDPADRAMWDAVRRLLCQYADAEFRTGTVRLDAVQWRQYLEKGFVQGSRAE